MSNGQNTGRRYIPKFFTYDGSTEWRPNIAYSAKTIVTRNFKVYTSIVNVPSNIGSPEDNPKYWQPAVINDEVMQTIIEELGKLDGDVSEFEHRVEVLENEVGELEVVIGDVQEDVSDLKNALMLQEETIPDTVQTITFDSAGNVSAITHTANNVAVRTDAFTFGTDTITEVRTLSTGESLTIVTNTTTLQTTVTYAAA